MINKVYKDDRLVATVIDFRGAISATTFFTDDVSSLQVGVISKNSEEKVQPHRHNLFERKIVGTSEFLYVLEGKMEVTVYDDNFQNPENFYVGVGSGVLLSGGAHSIQFVEATKLMEIKQGPYSAEVDKVYKRDINP